jgi:hypothetical protein
VLHVDVDEIEPGRAKNLGKLRTAQRGDPRSDLDLALVERTLDLVWPHFLTSLGRRPIMIEKTALQPLLRHRWSQPKFAFPLALGLRFLPSDYPDDLLDGSIAF